MPRDSFTEIAGLVMAGYEALYCPLIIPNKALLFWGVGCIVGGWAPCDSHDEERQGKSSKIIPSDFVIGLYCWLFGRVDRVITWDDPVESCYGFSFSECRWMNQVETWWRLENTMQLQVARLIVSDDF